MSKKVTLVREVQAFMDDYQRFSDRLTADVSKDTLPALAFSLNEDKNSYTVTRQRGDFALVEKLEVPELHEGKPVTRIGDGAFLFNNVQELTIPKTITHIEIDEEGNAFSLCKRLAHITVHSENTAYSSRDGVLFNKDQTVLLKFPENHAHSVYVIPRSVQSIGRLAFSDCTRLSEVTIPESVSAIGPAAFIRAAIRRVVIPKSVKVIEYFTFYYCTKLAEAIISDGVQRIENYSFSNCWSLTELTIPSSVEKISGKVFISSTNLNAVYGKGMRKKSAGWSKNWNLIDVGHRVKAYWDK